MQPYPARLSLGRRGTALTIQAIAGIGRTVPALRRQAGSSLVEFSSAAHRRRGIRRSRSSMTGEACAKRRSLPVCFLNLPVVPAIACLDSPFSGPPQHDVEAPQILIQIKGARQFYPVPSLMRQRGPFFIIDWLVTVTPGSPASGLDQDQAGPDLGRLFGSGIWMRPAPLPVS